MEQRNTTQKKIIRSVLCELNHPSAGMVYKAVHEKYPSISRATVYRVCAAMADIGEVRRFTFAGADDRFDITVKPHYHIVCRHCGEVCDVDLPFMDSLENTVKDASGYTVEAHSLEFSGVCPKCQK